MKAIIKKGHHPKAGQAFTVYDISFKGKVVLIIEGIKVEFPTPAVKFLQRTDNIDKTLDGDLMSRVEYNFLEDGNVAPTDPGRVSEILGLPKKYCAECLDYDIHGMPDEDWIRFQKIQKKEKVLECLGC